MPRATASARADDWRAHPRPQTPLQRAAFLDACTAWLSRAPAPGEADDALVPPTAYVGAPAPAAPAPPPVAYAASEARGARLACAACGAADGVRLVVANPFAQRHLVAACAACA